MHTRRWRWARWRWAARRTAAGLFATPASVRQSLHFGPERPTRGREGGAICAFDAFCVLVVPLVAVDEGGPKQTLTLTIDQVKYAVKHCIVTKLIWIVENIGGRGITYGARCWAILYWHDRCHPTREPRAAAFWALCLSPKCDCSRLTGPK